MDLSRLFVSLYGLKEGHRPSNAGAFVQTYILGGNLVAQLQLHTTLDEKPHPAEDESVGLSSTAKELTRCLPPPYTLGECSRPPSSTYCRSLFISGSIALSVSSICFKPTLTLFSPLRIGPNHWSL